MAEGAQRLVANRYLLHESVGRGGMGVVWRADDQVLGRSVAVKEVHLQRGLSDEDRAAVQQRVLREARAAACIDHAGAVTVYDVAEDDGQAYIVMELIDAPTLEDLVAERGPLPPDEVARIGLAILDVLTVAHDRGIVHRDLKPANVMVLDDDRVKLTDFGIATVKDDPRLTSTGIVLGSPSYLSPEQALGQRSTDETDLWGLGATLYFAVCGRPPFDRGEAIATLTAVAHEDLQVEPCAGELGPVLEGMLSKRPGDRPGLPELRGQLAAVAEERRGQDSAPHPRARRRRRPALLLALPILLALAAAVFLRSDGAGPPPAEASVGELVSYTHPEARWTVRYPKGWRVESKDRHRTDFREPGTGRYLRVGWTSTPGDDAVEAWRSEARSFAERYPTYSEIRIEKSQFRDEDAAVWEWTYRVTRDLHAINLGWVEGDRGYALNFQTREGDWDRSQALWQALQDGFEVPSG